MNANLFAPAFAKPITNGEWDVIRAAKHAVRPNRKVASSGSARLTAPRIQTQPTRVAA